MTSSPLSRPSLVHRRPGLLACLIVLIIAVAALGTAFVTRGSAPSPAEAGPGGPEVHDVASRVTYTLPAGWTAVPGHDFINGITSAGSRPASGDAAFLAVGTIDRSLLASSAPTATRAAQQLAVDFGEFYVPTPGRRQDPVDRPVVIDGRQGWTAGYTVVSSSTPVERTAVRVTVLQDGDRRVFALVVAKPFDDAVVAGADAAVSSIRFS